MRKNQSFSSSEKRQATEEDWQGVSSPRASYDEYELLDDDRPEVISEVTFSPVKQNEYQRVKLESPVRSKPSWLDRLRPLFWKPMPLGLSLVFLVILTVSACTVVWDQKQLLAVKSSEIESLQQQTAKIKLLLSQCTKETEKDTQKMSREAKRTTQKKLDPLSSVIVDHFNIVFGVLCLQVGNLILGIRDRRTSLLEFVKIVRKRG